MSFLFNRDQRTPYERAKDQSRAISSQVRKEKRQLDRQITQSDREILRLTNEIRQHAKQGNKEALRTLAKGVVKIKHQKSQLYAAKANLDTIDGAVKSQLTNVRLTGIMQKSSQIAQSLNELMKVEAFRSISQEFSKELIKMGIMDEMMNEAIDSAVVTDDLEEETDEEVAKILMEILDPRVKQLPTVVVPSMNTEITADAQADSDDEDLQTRLQALRS